MDEQNNSYNQLLKATSILGSSRVVTLVLGFVRTKLLAILLGPFGLGLIGTFQTIIDMLTAFCGFGLNTSAVRTIGDTQETDKPSKIAIFKRWFILSAFLGAIVCILLSYPLSIHYFSDKRYTLAIILLSFCIIFSILAGGRTAILQGMRQIVFIAKSNITGTVVSLLTIVTIYYFFGIKGIIPALIAHNIIMFLSINFFYKKAQPIKTKIVDNTDFKRVGKIALRLGLFITIAAVINNMGMLSVRYFAMYRVAHPDSLGLFQSVWTITNAFVGFIIAAAGTDYFARLCEVNNDDRATRKLVNEQTYIILIICCPIIIGLIIFAKYILAIQYSYEFLEASPMLRWQMLGVFLKLASTPLATILLAKNKGFIYLLSEVTYYISYVTLSYFLVKPFGIMGFGLAYFISYIIYFLLIIILGKLLSKHRWSFDSFLLFFIYGVLIFIACYLSKYHANYIPLVGSIVLLVSIGFSFYKLSQIFSKEQLIDWFKKK